MTTELTLREKVLEALSVIPGIGDLKALDAICNALDATGAPAYIRVADDLRGVVREEPKFNPPDPTINPYAFTRYLIRFGKLGLVVK